MEEINKRPLVQILTEQLKGKVVMDGEDYVYLENNIKVTDEEVAFGIKLQNELQETEILQQKIDEAKQYLVDTSWYIERLNDPSSGKDVPQEILDGRTNARLSINELEAV